MAAAAPMASRLKRQLRSWLGQHLRGEIQLDVGVSDAELDGMTAGLDGDAKRRMLRALGGASFSANQMQQFLNQKAASWIVHTVEAAACDYCLPECSPCCTVFGRILDKTVSDYLVTQGTSILTSVENTAASFVERHLGFI